MTRKRSQGARPDAASVEAVGGAQLMGAPSGNPAQAVAD